MPWFLYDTDFKYSLQNSACATNIIISCLSFPQLCYVGKIKTIIRIHVNILVYGQDRKKKQGRPVGKTKIILFDFLGRYIFKDHILHSKHRRKIRVK